MTTMTNKYRGICTGCGKRVEAGEGIYAVGNVWCEEPDITASFLGCSTAVSRHLAELARRGEQHKGMNDRTFVSQFDDVNQWLSNYWAKIDERNNDPEYQAEKKNRDEKRNREDTNWARRGLRRCPRCGGAGRSDRWIATGLTCYECEGHGAILA